jgi:dynein light chain LC8-type
MASMTPTIKNADMNEEMQQEAVECAVTAFGMYTVEKDIAAYLKKAFDKKYGATWHCIVGRNFGSFVTHGKARDMVFRAHARMQAPIDCSLWLLIEFFPHLYARNQALHLLLHGQDCHSVVQEWMKCWVVEV